MPQTEQEAANRVVWSMLWPDYPQVRAIFDAREDDAGGSWLTWTIEGAANFDEDALRGLTRRIDYLINDRLRKSFGQ